MMMSLLPDTSCRCMRYHTHSASRPSTLMPIAPTTNTTNMVLLSSFFELVEAGSVLNPDSDTAVPLLASWLSSVASSMDGDVTTAMGLRCVRRTYAVDGVFLASAVGSGLSTGRAVTVYAVTDIFVNCVGEEEEGTAVVPWSLTPMVFVVLATSLQMPQRFWQ